MRMMNGVSDWVANTMLGSTAAGFFLVAAGIGLVAAKDWLVWTVFGDELVTGVVALAIMIIHVHLLMVVLTGMLLLLNSLRLAVTRPRYAKRS